MILSVDLSNAFDNVDRAELFRGLAHLPIPHDPLGLLRAWHSDPTYFLEFGDERFSIPTSRGVRQGCTIAPLLWVLYVYHLVEKLRLLAPFVEWLQFLTLYADDLLLCLPINSEAEVQHMLDIVVFLLSFLEDHGLDVTYSKTQFLFKLSGTRASAVFKRHTLVQNGQRLLRLSHGRFPPLTSEIHYLGIVLSWDRTSELTLKTRLNKGKGAYAMLSRWWRRNALPPHAQLKLYYCMVLPVFTYGLSATGISAKGRIRLTTEVFRHLRRILRCPSHITRISNNAILKKYSLIHPLDRVSLGCCRLWCQMRSTLNADTCESSYLSSYLEMRRSQQTAWSQCVQQGAALIASRLNLPVAQNVAELGGFLLTLPSAALREAGYRHRGDSVPVVPPSAPTQDVPSKAPVQHTSASESQPLLPSV